MVRSSLIRNSVLLTAVVGLSLAISACSSADVEDVGEQGQAAKIKGDTNDCFPTCSQADWEKLVGKEEKNLKDACASILKDLQKRGNWKVAEKGKPETEICIGFKSVIDKVTDCNVYSLTPQDDCKNQAMLQCSKIGAPGFGKLRPVPPPKDPKYPPGGPLPGFPPPKDPKNPSVTDQEIACIAQWKCPNTLKTFSAGVNPTATTTARASADVCTTDSSASCGVCEEWVVPYTIPDAIDAKPEPSIDVARTYETLPNTF